MNIKPGMLVVVRGEFGMAKPKTVLVKDYTVEGKNDEDTISYLDEDGDMRWAYVSQVDRVIGHPA